MLLTLVTQNSWNHFAEMFLISKSSVKIFLTVSLFKINSSAIIRTCLTKLVAALFPHFRDFVGFLVVRLSRFPALF
jgi:hypothetical protein